MENVLSFIIFMAMVLGFLFPMFLVRAINLPEGDKKWAYTTASCVSFGIIVFAIIQCLISIDNA